MRVDTAVGIVVAAIFLLDFATTLDLLSLAVVIASALFVIFS